MPLSVLLLLVTGGIASVAILLHLLGLSKPRVFEDDAAVLAVWRGEYPDLPARRVRLSRNRQFALVETDSGLGVVWPMGLDAAARLLLGVEIEPDPRGLHLSLPDFTAPDIRLRLDPDEARDWQRQIEETA